jgi:hypothetical protein
LPVEGYQVYRATQKILKVRSGFPFRSFLFHDSRLLSVARILSVFINPAKEDPLIDVRDESRLAQLSNNAYSRAIRIGKCLEVANTTGVTDCGSLKLN